MRDLALAGCMRGNMKFVDQNNELAEEDKRNADLKEQQDEA